MGVCRGLVVLMRSARLEVTLAMLSLVCSIQSYLRALSLNERFRDLNQLVTSVNPA